MRKKPSSLWHLPPTSPRNGITAKVFLDDIISKESKSKGTVKSLLQSDTERKRKWMSFFFPFLLWHEPLRWLHGLVSYGYLGYVFSLETATLESKQFDKGCVSSADDGRQLRILQPQTATSQCDANVTRCCRNPDDRTSRLHGATYYFF